MNPERWERVQAIFHEAMAEGDLAARERVARALCADDASLLEDVLPLLQSADEGDAVERIVRDAPRPSSDAPLIGRTIGPYRVEGELGRGGMGTVYLGVRADDQYVKKVAIKTARAWSDPELRRRFRAERQILAGLDHPAIAHLLDGGETDDGAPYLVMEYVDGVPIDEYCEANTVALRDRVRLFRSVCDGVDYAHRRLVVHRDLKPSNILVDGEGRPRLLDFGIAKLLDAELPGGGLTETVAHARRFTPEYASPEQVRGEPVTTGTDVYSLGVLLYGILAGRRPYEITSTSAREMERMVCETDPPPPSDASGRRELAGDLDNIVGKALHKDPALRYGSVAELSADLDRYLRGLPVTARPDTWRYRAAKFVRRNRATVAAASVAVVALTGAAVVSTVAFVRANRARTEAETQRDTLQQVNAFLRDMFEAADPVATQEKGGLTARAVLDVAAGRIEAELGDQPTVAAALRTTIASSYEQLDEPEEAAALVRAAVDVLREQGRLATPEGVRALVQLGRLERKLDRLDEAEAGLREAVALSDGLAPGSLEAARARAGLGAALTARGEGDEALDLLEAALTGVEGHGEAGEQLELQVRNDLALYWERRGEYTKAEENLRFVLAAQRDRLGDSHSEVGQLLSTLAFVLNRLERHDEAVEAARQSLEVNQRVYDEGHGQIARARLNLAEALHRSGRTEEAEAEYRRALEAFRAIYGDSHSTTAVVLGNFAMVYLETQRYDEALELLDEARSTYERSVGGDHPWALANRHNVAHTFWSAGRYAESERECLATLERRRATLDENHLDIARSEMLLGRLLMERSAHADAEAPLRDCLRISEASLPAGHSFRIEAQYLLGRCLLAAGPSEEAERHLVAAHAAYESVQGTDARTTRRVADQLRVLYEQRGEPDLAGRYGPPATAAR